MANSVHTHLIWLPAFFVCFQDITISISSFISHPSGHFFSISLLPLPHLLDTHVLDCPGISRWTTFLFYPSTWFLHLMSNGHLKYNLSQTKPLIFSFKIRSSHSFFHQFSTDEGLSCFVDINHDTSLPCDRHYTFILFSSGTVPHCVGLSKITPKVFILGKENGTVLWSYDKLYKGTL